MSLTQKQSQFCEVYFRTGNATQAYREAYSVENMKETSIGRKAFHTLNLPNVQSRIKELRSEITNRNIVTIEMVANEYRKIAFTDLPGIIDYKGGKMSITDFENLTADQRACIKEFKFKTEYKIVDETKVPVDCVEFKMHDKQHALDMLGKYLGMFVEKSEIEHKFKGPSPINFGDNSKSE